MATKKLQIIGGSMLQSDWEEADPTYAAYIKNKPNLPASALSGSYNDLKDKPEIDSSITEDSTNAVTGGAVYEELAKKANVADLSSVATSGSYNDLIDKPDIGNEVEAGLTKLYSNTGDNTDGAMTQKAITEVFNKNKPQLKSVTIPYESWEGEGPYTQSLSISDITVNSKIDMQADATTIANIVDGEFSITIKNDNGIVTAYAVGKKPKFDLELTLSIIEVVKENDEDAIWGSPLVGTGMSGSFRASVTAPDDINYLWIDINNGNLLKYYNGADWVPISAAWG
jgi:hypothetical protein